MPEFDRTEVANCIAQAAAVLQPTDDTWGLYVWDDHSAGVCGGGVGCILWFSEEGALREYLRVAIPTFAGVDDHGDDCDDATQKVIDFADRWDAEGAPLAQRVAELNAQFKGVFQVGWVGQLKELLMEEGFGAEVREWYRANAGLEVTSLPIQAKERDAFIAALGEYGV